MAKSKGSSEGMSTTAKVVLIIIGAGGLLIAVCCGGMIWWGSRMITTDPAKVRERTTAIVDITIPAKYAPTMSMDMSKLGLPMTMCMYMTGDQQGGVIIMEMSGPAAGNREQMKQQFQQGFRQQQQNPNQQITVTSTETRTFQIDGEEYEFEFAQGTRQQDGAAMRQVMGVIPGKNGAAFLMMFEPEASWDEAAVLEMIESMGAVETTAPASHETGTDAAVPDATGATPADPGQAD